MTLTEIAFNVHYRPVATVLELTVSTLARLIGVRGADIFMEIAPKEEVRGQSFFNHYSDQTRYDRYHDIMLGRIHLVFSRDVKK